MWLSLQLSRMDTRDHPHGSLRGEREPDIFGATRCHSARRDRIISTASRSLDNGRGIAAPCLALRGLGLAAQRYDIEAFGAREGFTVHSWYQDIQTGAGKDALLLHPELAAALKEARSARCPLIVAKPVARRSLSGTGERQSEMRKLLSNRISQCCLQQAPR